MRVGAVLCPASGGLFLAQSVNSRLPTRPLQNEESLGAMKKTKLTRSLMAACSIVALSAVMYGCVHSGDDGEAPVVVDMDMDGDGVADVADAFPDDPAETKDSDDDGVGNNADAFPFDGTETADADGDGVGDNADAFPMDATETADADGDGVGDNADAFPGDDDQRRGGRLVQVANAYGVEDLATTPTVDEQAQAVMPFVTAVNTAAAAADNGETGTTATATWPGVPDNPETANTDESAMNVLSIDVTPANMGGALEFRTEAAEENDPNTTVDETIVTATDIGGLGDFMNGYLISDGNRHVIVFTDKDQKRCSGYGGNWGGSRDPHQRPRDRQHGYRSGHQLRNRLYGCHLPTTVLMRSLTKPTRTWRTWVV